MNKRADFVAPAVDTRELSFKPTDPTRAQQLSVDAVETYNTNGLVGQLPLFSSEEVTDIHRYVSRLVDDAVAAPDQRDSYSVNAYHLACRGLYDLAMTPRLLDYVADLLGPDFVCWGTTVFCKLPRDPKEIPLHQDAAYWPFTPSRTVTAWLSTDGADQDNSAMQFIPGSHLAGPLDHVDLPLDASRARRRQVVHAERHSGRRDNILAAGEVSLHSDLLLHGSPPNRSDRRRTGLAVRYAAAEVRTLPGWEWWYGGAMHCRGTIPAHWPNRRRPRGEHPEMMAMLASGGVPGGG